MTDERWLQKLCHFFHRKSTQLSALICGLWGDCWEGFCDWVSHRNVAEATLWQFLESDTKTLAASTSCLLNILWERHKLLYSISSVLYCHVGNTVWSCFRFMPLIIFLPHYTPSKDTLDPAVQSTHLSEVTQWYWSQQQVGQNSPAEPDPHDC